MQEFEVKRIIGNLKINEEISLYANNERIKGILIDYDEDYVKIKSNIDEEIITIPYSDISEI